MTPGPHVIRAALALDEADAATILTWTDEPELLAAPGQAIPVFHPDDVAAARLRSAWSQLGTLESMQ